MKTLIITITLLATSLVFSQTIEEDFLNFEPEKTQAVTEKDFRFAKMVIENTKEAIIKDEGQFNISDYYNIATAYNALKLPKQKILQVFERALQSEGACEYVIKLEDNISFDSTIPEAYAKAKKKCLQTCAEKQQLAFETATVTDLQQLIDIVDERDQKFRNQDKMDPRQTHYDQMNQKTVDSLLTKHQTFIGNSLVGQNRAHVVWSVIQHANVDYMEKYLPIVTAAVKDGELNEVPLRMLIDRYYGLKYGYQVFGSQSGFDFELATEEQKQIILEKYFN